MSKILKSPPVMLLLGFTAISAHADIILKYTSQSHSEPNIVMVSGAMVRTESTKPGGKSVSIFDNDKKTLTLIDDQQKSYVVVDNASIEKQAKRIHEMRKRALNEMQQQLQEMSPAQQQLMEQRMAEMGVSTDQSEHTPSRFFTARTHRSKAVNGVRCEVYESFRNSEKIGEACIAGPEALEISSSDYKTLQDLFAFLRSMTKRIVSEPAGAGAEMSMFDNVEGLPVKMANTQGDTMTLQHVSNQALPPELFVVPSDYKLADMADVSVFQR